MHLVSCAASGVFSSGGLFASLGEHERRGAVFTRWRVSSPLVVSATDTLPASVSALHVTRAALMRVAQTAVSRPPTKLYRK